MELLSNPCGGLLRLWDIELCLLFQMHTGTHREFGEILATGLLTRRFHLHDILHSVVKIQSFFYILSFFRRITLGAMRKSSYFVLLPVENRSCLEAKKLKFKERTALPKLYELLTL